MIDFARPENWSTLYDAELVHVDGLPLPPVILTESFDYRYLRLTVTNEQAKPIWERGAYLDLLVDELVPKVRAYRFEADVNETALFKVPDFLPTYKIRTKLPRWFRCADLKIEAYKEPALTYSYYGDYIPTQFAEYNNLEVASPLTFSADGNITKLRFYKAESETGNHTMKIWSTTGDLLVNLPFTNTVTGWNEQALETPFAIANGDTYRISVNTNTYLTYIDLEFPIPPDSNPVKFADGQNGYYNFSLHQFPNAGQGDGGYYLADVVFEVG